MFSKTSNNSSGVNFSPPLYTRKKDRRRLKEVGSLLLFLFLPFLCQSQITSISEDNPYHISNMDNRTAFYLTPMVYLNIKEDHTEGSFPWGASSWERRAEIGKILYDYEPRWYGNPCRNEDPNIPDNPCWRDKILFSGYTSGDITPYGKIYIDGVLPPKQEIVYDTANAWETEYVNYIGNWAIPPKEGATGCKCSYSKDTLDYMEITFYGTGFELYGENKSHLNTASIILDGVLYGEVDEFEEPDVDGQILIWEESSLNRNTHDLKIVVTGRNVNSRNTYFVFHKLIALDLGEEPPTVPPTDTIFVRDTIWLYSPKLMLQDTSIYYQLIQEP